MKYLFLILLILVQISFVLYLQLLAHKDELDAKHRKYFDLAHNLFGPLLKFAGSMSKPYKAGPNLMLDLGPPIVMAILAALSLLFFIR